MHGLMLFSVWSLQQEEERKKGRLRNLSARSQASTNPNQYFFNSEKGICQSGEGQGLEKPFHSTLLSVSSEQPGAAQTFCNLRENPECLSQAAPSLLSLPVLHASCNSEGCRRGRPGSPLPLAGLACGPAVQDGACGTRWHPRHKMAPVAQPALLGLLLAACGTPGTRSYPRLSSAIVTVSWGSFSDLHIGRERLKAFV